MEKTFLDVRTPAEFSEEHIPGAINIPVDQLQNRLNELNGKPAPFVAYCRSGARSAMAVGILKQNGFNNVINGGGIADVKAQLS